MSLSSFENLLDWFVNNNSEIAQPYAGLADQKGEAKVGLDHENRMLYLEAGGTRLRLEPKKYVAEREKLREQRKAAKRAGRDKKKTRKAERKRKKKR